MGGWIRPGCLKLTLVHTCGVVHCRDIVAGGKARAVKGVVLCSSDTAREGERQGDKTAVRPHCGGRLQTIRFP